MGACLSAPDTGSKKETGAAGATKGGKVRSRGAGGTRESGRRRPGGASGAHRACTSSHPARCAPLPGHGAAAALPLPPTAPARSHPLQAGALAAFDETLILGKVTPDVKELYDSESRKRRRAGAPAVAAAPEIVAAARRAGCLA